MNFITIIAVLLISLLFTLVFVVGLKCRGPWRSGWAFFAIICLWLVAVSLWIPPAGPVWAGVPWIDLVLTGLLVSFIMSATPTDASSSSSEQNDERESDKHTLRENSENQDTYLDKKLSSKKSGARH